MWNALMHADFGSGREQGRKSTAARLAHPCVVCSAETFNALLLAKSLRNRMWTDSTLETRQLAGIGPQIAAKLAAAGAAAACACSPLQLCPCRGRRCLWPASRKRHAP